MMASRSSSPSFKDKSLKQSDSNGSAVFNLSDHMKDFNQMKKDHNNYSSSDFEKINKWSHKEAREKRKRKYQMTCQLTRYQKASIEEIKRKDFIEAQGSVFFFMFLNDQNATRLAKSKIDLKAKSQKIEDLKKTLQEKKDKVVKMSEELAQLKRPLDSTCTSGSEPKHQKIEVENNKLRQIITCTMFLDDPMNIDPDSLNKLSPPDLVDTFTDFVKRKALAGEASHESEETGNINNALKITKQEPMNQVNVHSIKNTKFIVGMPKIKKLDH